MSDSLYHNYASALFDLVEGDRYEDYLSAVRETEKNLLEQREFLSFLSSYEIPLSDKEKAIEKIYGPLKLPYYTDFLKLLTKKHRIASFEIISREFGELVCEKLGIIEGIIYSVEKLPAAKIHTVEDAFAKKFGKKVELKQPRRLHLRRKAHWKQLSQWNSQRKAQTKRRTLPKKEQ